MLRQCRSKAFSSYSRKPSDFLLKAIQIHNPDAHFHTRTKPLLKPSAQLSKSGKSLDFVHSSMKPQTYKPNFSVRSSILERNQLLKHTTPGIRFISSTPLRKEKNASSKNIVSSNKDAKDSINAESINDSNRNMGQRIQAAMEWRLSDLMGVWGAGTLFVGIIFSPYIIE